jgi:hypothetical protein
LGGNSPSSHRPIKELRPVIFAKPRIQHLINILATLAKYTSIICHFIKKTPLGFREAFSGEKLKNNVEM